MPTFHVGHRPVGFNAGRGLKHGRAAHAPVNGIHDGHELFAAGGVVGIAPNGSIVLWRIHLSRA